MRHAHVFAANTDQLPAVRDWTRSVLPAWIPSPTREDALLVVTELAANSCRHTTSPCVHVTIDVRPGRLRITVRDFGARRDPARPPHGDSLTEDGRGQLIVRALARRLRLRTGPAGHTATAVLTLPRRG